MSSKNKTFFIGGRCGQKKDKITKQPLFKDDAKTIPDMWYYLSFAIPNTQTDLSNKTCFGWQSGNVWTDEETYKTFMKFQPMSDIDVCVVNARGSFMIINY